MRKKKNPLVPSQDNIRLSNWCHTAQPITLWCQIWPQGADLRKKLRHCCQDLETSPDFCLGMWASDLARPENWTQKKSMSNFITELLKTQVFHHQHRKHQYSTTCVRKKKIWRRKKEEECSRPWFTGKKQNTWPAIIQFVHLCQRLSTQVTFSSLICAKVQQINVFKVKSRIWRTKQSNRNITLTLIVPEAGGHDCSLVSLTMSHGNNRWRSVHFCSFLHLPNCFTCRHRALDSSVFLPCAQKDSSLNTFSYVPI